MVLPITRVIAPGPATFVGRETATAQQSKHIFVQNPSDKTKALDQSSGHPYKVQLP